MFIVQLQDYIKHSVSVLPTHAHGLVSSGLEAVVAETAITSLRVNTLSVAACVRNLLALITVCDRGDTNKMRAWCIMRLIFIAAMNSCPQAELTHTSPTGGQFVAR